MPLLKKKLTAKNVNEKSKNGKFRYFGFFFCLQLCQTCKKKRKFLMCINVFKCRLLFKEVQMLRIERDNKNVEKTRNLSTCSVLNLVFVLFTGNKLEINWVYIHNALSWATCNAIKVKLTPRPSLVLFVLCSFFKHLKKLPKFQNFKIFFSFSLSLNQA